MNAGRVIFLICILRFYPGAVSVARAQAWTQTAAPSNIWSAIAVSADGSKWVATAGGQFYNGQIYFSTNPALPWSPTPAPATNWTGVASSADGSNLVAVAYGSAGGAIANSGIICASTNGSGIWSTTNFSRTWLSVASSADGQKVAAVPNSSRVFLSTNAGATWFSNAAPVADLQRIVSSADGTRLAAGNNVGSIVISSNSGTT